MAELDTAAGTAPDDLREGALRKNPPGISPRRYARGTHEEPSAHYATTSPERLAVTVTNLLGLRDHDYLGVGTISVFLSRYPA